jgi:hypothetical protein
VRPVGSRSGRSVEGVLLHPCSPAGRQGRLQVDLSRLPGAGAAPVASTSGAAGRGWAGTAAVRGAGRPGAAGRRTALAAGRLRDAATCGVTRLSGRGVTRGLRTLVLAAVARWTRALARRALRRVRLAAGFFAGAVRFTFFDAFGFAAARDLTGEDFLAAAALPALPFLARRARFHSLRAAVAPLRARLASRLASFRRLRARLSSSLAIRTRCLATSACSSARPEVSEGAGSLPVFFFMCGPVRGKKTSLTQAPWRCHRAKLSTEFVHNHVDRGTG